VIHVSLLYKQLHRDLLDLHAMQCDAEWRVTQSLHKNRHQQAATLFKMLAMSSLGYCVSNFTISKFIMFQSI
jgi:hypothetical protein